MDMCIERTVRFYCDGFRETEQIDLQPGSSKYPVYPVITGKLTADEGSRGVAECG